MNGTLEYKKKFGELSNPKTATATTDIKVEAKFHPLDSDILIEQFRGLAQKVAWMTNLANY